MNGCRHKCVTASLMLAGAVAVHPILLTAGSAHAYQNAEDGLEPTHGLPVALGDLQAAVNESLGLRRSHLTFPKIEGDVAHVIRAQVSTGKDTFSVVLKPRSIRANDFRLAAQAADGRFVDIQPGPERTLRGVVENLPGSVVAGSLLEAGLYATLLLPHGAVYWVEPVAGRIPNAPAGLHVVYRSNDVLPVGLSCALECRRALDDAGMVISGAPATAPAMAGPSLGPLCFAELATDADVEYFQAYGSVAAVLERVSLVINTMNVQYEAEVGISHTLGTMLVRTAEPDPYSQTDAPGLLCEFINEWTNNQSAIERDIAQLFTAKNFSFFGYAAEIGSVCEPDGCTSFPCTCKPPPGFKGSYCLVRSDCCGGLACATALSAHELGHLWGAVHCDPCLGTTMQSSTDCANTFAQSSIDLIVAFRDTVPCLACTDALVFSFPDDLPQVIAPAGGTTVQVIVAPGYGIPVAGTGLLHLSVDNGPFVPSAMSETGPNDYTATFPALSCTTPVQFYFSAQTSSGGMANSPVAAPVEVYSAIAATGVATVFLDEFETDQAWTVQDGAGLTDGTWERGVPLPHTVCNRANPGADGDGSGSCFLTDNSSANQCNSDVDGGSTTLMSAMIDAAAQGTPIVSYYRWFHNSFGDPFTEEFIVDVSDDGGATWSRLETVGPGGPEVSGGWFFRQFRITDAGIGVTDQFRIRFIAQDPDPPAVIEAGADGVKLLAAFCCPWDCGNDDNIVGIEDFLALLQQWGGPGSCDFDGDGFVAITDFLKLQGHWGACP